MFILVTILSAMQRPSHPSDMDQFIPLEPAAREQQPLKQQYASSALDRPSIEDANKKMSNHLAFGNIYPPRGRRNYHIIYYLFHSISLD